MVHWSICVFQPAAAGLHHGATSCDFCLMETLIHPWVSASTAGELQWHFLVVRSSSTRCGNIWFRNQGHKGCCVQVRIHCKARLKIFRRWLCFQCLRPQQRCSAGVREAHCRKPRWQRIRAPDKRFQICTTGAASGIIEGANLLGNHFRNSKPPLWVSVDGNRVPWLQVRLGTEPRHYKHTEYPCYADDKNAKPLDVSLVNWK